MPDPHNLVLADNERVVRAYEASYLERPKATGYLVATNRRLVFVGESSGVLGESVMHREIDITHVTGLFAYYDSGKSFGVLVVAAILSLVFFILGHVSSLLFLGLLWPAFLVYRFFTNAHGRNAQMQVAIMASGSDASPIAFGEVQQGDFLRRIMSFFGAGGGNAWMSLIAGPGRDATALVRELGALVLDIQSLGDHALEKWQPTPKRTGQSSDPSSEHQAPASSNAKSSAEHWDFDQ